MSQAVTISYEFSSTRTSTASTASATSGFGQPFPAELELSPVQELDRVLSDVPFFCTGFLAITVLFFCLTLSKLRKPLVYIIGAAVVAFISVIVDLVAVLHASTTSTFAALVTREMGLASFTGLLFFSFWIYCDATPPYKNCPLELSLPAPSTETDRPAQTSNGRAGRNANSTWPGPAAVRAILMYGSLLACFSVMALQMIWRFGYLFSLNKLLPEYRADSIAEISLALLFSGKILFDSITAKDEIPWYRIWRASGPMIFAMLTQMGIAIGNLIVGAKLANWALPDFAQVNVSQNDVGLGSPSRESSIAERERRNTIASSRSAASQWSTPTRAVADRIDSPVYGLEGIVRNLRKEDAKQQQAFAQFTGIVGSPPRELFSPIPAPAPSKPVTTKRFSRRKSSNIPPPQKPPPTALAPQPVLPRVVLPPAQSNRQSSRPEEMSDGSKSLATTPGQESILTSEFSLSQFPTPPAALESAYYDGDDTSIEEGSPTVTGHPKQSFLIRDPQIGSPPKGGLPPTPAKRKMTNDSLLVDDIPFTLIPPKMPAAMAEVGRSRQESFPSTTRGSDLSNIFSGQLGNPVGQNAQEGTRINVTSFIG
ncbi:hypothetical protein FRC01_010122, partial [Tulasnella sp. 417]